jgi:hypothetical protein
MFATSLVILSTLLGPNYASSTDYFKHNYMSKIQNFFPSEHENRQNMTSDKEVQEVIGDANYENAKIIDEINLRFSPGPNNKSFIDVDDIEDIEILPRNKSIQHPKISTRHNQILNQIQNLNTFHAVPNDEIISSQDISLLKIRNNQHSEMFHMPSSALRKLKPDRKSRVQIFLTFLCERVPMIAIGLLIGLFVVLCIHYLRVLVGFYIS